MPEASTANDGDVDGLYEGMLVWVEGERKDGEMGWSWGDVLSNVVGRLDIVRASGRVRSYGWFMSNGRLEIGGPWMEGKRMMTSWVVARKGLKVAMM